MLLETHFHSGLLCRCPYMRTCSPCVKEAIEKYGNGVVNCGSDRGLC